MGAALYVLVQRLGKIFFREREKGVVEVFRFLNLVTGSLARYFLKKLYFNPLFSELVMLCQEAIFLTLKSLMLCDCILPTIIDPKHDGTGVPSLKSPHTGLPREPVIAEMLPSIKM